MTGTSSEHQEKILKTKPLLSPDDSMGNTRASSLDTFLGTHARPEVLAGTPFPWRFTLILPPFSRENMEILALKNHPFLKNPWRNNT